MDPVAFRGRVFFVWDDDGPQAATGPQPALSGSGQDQPYDRNRGEKKTHQTKPKKAAGPRTAEASQTM